MNVGKMKSLLINVVVILFLETVWADHIKHEEVNGVVGQSVELPCNVTAEKEDDVLSVLVWFKNNSSTAIYSSSDFRDGDNNAASSSRRYRLVTSTSGEDVKLQIVTVRPSDAGLYHCRADFAASSSRKTYILLDVIEPPAHLWVVHENSTQVAKASPGVNMSQNVGPYYIGDTVRLACVAFGGKPLAALSWWTDRRLLKNTLTPLSEHRVRSDLTYGPLLREDHGRVFSCVGKNNEQTPPLSIDITINMYLPPDLVSLRTEGPDSNASIGRVRAGEALALQCRVLGARPLPRVVWLLDDNQLIGVEEKITKEPSQRLIVSEVQLTVDRSHDESRLTCCAPARSRDGDRLVCAQPLPLTVTYLPVLEISAETEAGSLVNNTLAVVKGSNVSLACQQQANPAVYELYWFHKDDMIENPDKDSKQHPLLEIRDISEDDAGDYACVASNDEGPSYSDPINIDVIYPASCEETSRLEYGVAANEAVNLTCNVKSNPSVTSYRWAIIYGEFNSSYYIEHPDATVVTEENVLRYTRNSSIAYTTIYCWGINGVPTDELDHFPCAYVVTDETAPRPPSNCDAKKTETKDLVVTCEKGHDGGLPQKFKFIIQRTDSDEELVSIISKEPQFLTQEPKEEDYKIVIIAFNEKGESQVVEIDRDSIVDQAPEPEVTVSAVQNITTLALALCGGVALVALAACGLVLCTYERTSRLDLPRDSRDPPLCAYTTEESNCETYQDSDEGSECNVRRTDSFRRAVSRRPSRNFDVRRTSSFHSARYMNDMAEPDIKCNEISRHGNCRVHSLQNINRRREMDALCDHLVLHLPPETNYNVSKPMNTFYTMPRKIRHKMAKELSDDRSEITQTSDGFSLPPPPDEFGTYRAGTKIRDIPAKTTPTYTTIINKPSPGRDPLKQQYNSPVSPMNTVGIPTISGHSGVYSYPEDDHHPHQDMVSTSGVFPTYFTPRESGL